jgi:hypothetical protein
MDAFKELLQINFVSFFIAVFVILTFIVSAVQLIGQFSKIVGKPFRWVKKKDEDHELLVNTINKVNDLEEKQRNDTKESIRHDEMIRHDLNKVSITVDEIAATLSDMKKKDNATEVKKLKDKIVGYYNEFKDVGEWTKVDKDVFWDLFDDYDARGGDGFVHSIIEPVMRQLKEID